MAFAGVSVAGALQAYAFQEQQVRVTTPEVVTSRVLPPRNLDLLAISGTDEDAKIAPKKDSGLYIPGLGALPDLNFGLELLYDDKALSNSDALKDDSIAIKGRIHQKF